MPILEVQGLVKSYGRRRVVDGVNFEVEAGEVVGLLGPNGAGKTTSFRMTTGQITPDDGQVLFNGQDVTRLPMYKRARLGMGYLSQETSVFRKLTVEQNILAILEVMPFLRCARPAASRAGALGADRRRARTVRPDAGAQERRGPAVRRREAPAGDRPLPRLRAAADPARRAVHRHRPDHHRRHPPDRPRPARTRASACCSPTTTSARR